jgi:hypothetical protein
MPKYFALSLLRHSEIVWVKSCVFYSCMSTSEHPCHFRANPGSYSLQPLLYQTATPCNRAASQIRSRVFAARAGSCLPVHGRRATKREYTGDARRSCCPAEPARRVGLCVPGRSTMSGGVNRGLGGVGGPAASRSQWFATNDELFISGDLFSTLDGLAPEPTDMELAGDFDHVRWIKHHELLFLEAGTRCKVMHADSFGAAVRWDVVQEPWDSDDEPDPRYTHSRQCWRDWSMWNPDKVQIVGAPVLAQTNCKL